MARDPADAFRDLAPRGGGEATDVNYPGSKRPRRAVSGEQAPSTWDTIPFKSLTLRGKPTRFYTLGVLAAQLGRQTQTVRKWERKGYLPATSFRAPGENEHGQKRLYTREQIEGVVAIAREEGILGGRDGRDRNVSMTRFAARVAKLFEALA